MLTQVRPPLGRLGHAHARTSSPGPGLPARGRFGTHDGGAGPAKRREPIRIWLRSICIWISGRRDVDAADLGYLARSGRGCGQAVKCEMVRTLVALAATCRRARDLCTPGLRAYMVYVMAHSLSQGGAFLEIADTLVASLIKHTAFSTEDWDLCRSFDEAYVLVPLLRCTDWIDFGQRYFEVFTNYPSTSTTDMTAACRLGVAALLLCQVAAPPRRIHGKFDDVNWDFSAGCEDDDDHRFSHVENITVGHAGIMASSRTRGGRRADRLKFLRFLANRCARTPYSRTVHAGGAGTQGTAPRKWAKKHRRPRSAQALMKLGDDRARPRSTPWRGSDRNRSVSTSAAPLAEAALAEAALVMVRPRTRPRARRRRIRRRQISSRRRGRGAQTGDDEEGQKKGKKAGARAAPAPAPASAAEASSSSSSSSEDDEDDDVLLLAKPRASRSAPRARARTKAAPAAAPRVREVNPAMAFARALRGWIVSRGGRIVGTDLAQFYKSSAARGLEEVPKGGALKLLRTVAAPAGLRIAQTARALSSPASGRWRRRRGLRPPPAEPFLTSPSMMMRTTTPAQRTTRKRGCPEARR